MITEWIIEITGTDIIGITIFVFSFSVIISSSIIILFIYKLFQIYHSYTINDAYIVNGYSLLSVITKNTILTLFCISSSIIEIMCISYCVISTGSVRRSDLLYTFCEFVTLFDIITNFICIAFTYSFFDGHYNLLCGCLDRACKSCITKSKRYQQNNQETEPLIQHNAFEV